MSIQIPEQFTGYGAKDEAAGKAFDLQLIKYTPRKFTEEDVVVKIDACGVCGSDIHTVSNSWPSPTQYHKGGCIVGHEIVGIVARAGEKSGLKEGQRVGIGAQSFSCGSCEFCEKHLESYCVKGMGGTYQGKIEGGSYNQGGYADFILVSARFAIPIPDGLETEVAAPLLCAGVTVYSPLKRWGAGKGKKVAIVGIGGLGHLGLQFSNALGAETFALSHSDSKLKDAEKLGVKAENFIITKDEKATVKKWANSFDIIVCTAFTDNLPIDSLYFKLLRPLGALVLVGLPESKLPEFYGQALVGKGISLSGSLIGGTTEIKDMLQLAVEKNVRPWTIVRPMSEAAQVVKDMDAGKARYRYVLKN